MNIEQGTLELLLTQPLTEIQVVLAKFLGSWAVSIGGATSNPFSFGSLENWVCLLEL